MLNSTKIVFASIFLVALGYIAFKIFKRLEDKAKSLSSISKIFGLLSILLLLYFMFFLFITYLSFITIYKASNNFYIGRGITIFTYFSQFKVRLHDQKYRIIFTNTNPVLFIAWSICAVLALFICLRIYSNLQNIDEVKMSKMLLFIPILLISFVLTVFVYIAGKSLGINFIKEDSFFALNEKTKSGTVPCYIFSFSVFSIFFIFRYLSKKIPSSNNSKPMSYHNSYNADRFRNDMAEDYW